MRGKFAQHKVPLRLLFWEDNHRDVICLTKLCFGTHSAAISMLMISHALKISVCLISLCFILMWGLWHSSWLQLAGRSHCLCTFVSLQGNYQVKELDLSHNEFCEKGGQLLGQMLGNLIYYSRKARSTGTGGLDGVSTVNMHFLLQQKCPMT